MSFSPFDALSNRGAEAGLSNLTGYPGVEIDLASGAPVHVKIPYCAPLSHYNLVDTHSNMGELRINAINPIRDGNSPANTVEFTLYAWFEDIELAMPTSKSVVVPTLEAQIADETAATSGPTISGIATGVANIVSEGSKMIPAFTSALKPVEWISRAVGASASAMGFNKPTNLDKNSPYVNIPAKGYTNVDGIDLSVKLGAMPDNSLTQDEGLFSTSVDEMDISYVCSKSCIQTAEIQWNLNSNGLLYSVPVTPGALGFGSSSNNLPATTLAFVASPFKYWRGSLKYRITVAKTAFHSGRLRIAYHPGVSDVTNVVDQNAYNWILDLSSSSELEIEIPYVSNTPWRQVYLDGSNSTEWFNREFAHTGFLTISVLNQLKRASDSVSSEAPINVWISGGEDIAFAIPDFSNYTPAEIPQKLEAQIFNMADSGESHREQITNQADKMFPMNRMGITDAEQLSIGEKITNLRQLIKRFTPTFRGLRYPYVSANTSRYSYIGPFPLNNDNYLINQLTIDPAFFGDATGEVVPSPDFVTLPQDRAVDGTFTDDNSFISSELLPLTNPLHYLSFIYRFWRGSRRYKVVFPPGEEVKEIVQGLGSAESDGTFAQRLSSYGTSEGRSQAPVYVQRDNEIVTNGTLERPRLGTFSTSRNQPQFEHLVFPDINGVLEFEVPYYSMLPISVVGQRSLSDTDGPLVERSLIRVRKSLEPRGMDQPSYYPFVGNRYVTNTVADQGTRPCFGACTLYEAAGDDFSFGYLIGAPTLIRMP
jgi:hypothetical protein